MRLAPYLLASGLAMLPRALLTASLGAATASLDAGEHAAWEWPLIAVGIAATLAATLLLARRANEELGREPAAALRESGTKPREPRADRARQGSEP